MVLIHMELSGLSELKDRLEGNIPELFNEPEEAFGSLVLFASVKAHRLCSFCVAFAFPFRQTMGQVVGPLVLLLPPASCHAVLHRFVFYFIRMSALIFAEG